MLHGDDADNAVTDHILRCAIEVHRLLGPGLLESVYERALCREFTLERLAFSRQVRVPLFYKGELISEHRPDLVVAARIVGEVKSAARIEPVHVAQVLTYLRVLDLQIGLLLNFNTAVMKHGVRRVMR